MCSHPPVADGTRCTGDGNRCTDDFCQNGICIHVPCDPALEITGTDPAGPVLLGANLTIHYVITSQCQAGFNGFDQVQLEIRNQSGGLVVQSTGWSGALGAHTAVWTQARWNQGSHAGAFANPGSGPYEVRLIATGADCPTSQGATAAATHLVLEADLVDDPPAGPVVSRSAGLEDMLDALKIVLKLGAQETVISGPGSIVMNGPDPEHKHIRVDTPALNGLPGGAYEVLFRDLRDEIGNFADADGNPGNGIQPLSFNLEIR